MASYMKYMNITLLVICDLMICIFNSQCIKIYDRSMKMYCKGKIKWISVAGLMFWSIFRAKMISNICIPVPLTLSDLRWTWCMTVLHPGTWFLQQNITYKSKAMRKALNIDVNVDKVCLCSPSLCIFKIKRNFLVVIQRY